MRRFTGVREGELSMVISKGWRVAVRLFQDKENVYGGVVQGFILPDGTRVDQCDVFKPAQHTQCLVALAAHTGIRHVLIGGSLDEGWDEVYPAARPVQELSEAVSGVSEEPSGND